jgi:serine protease AprX
MSKHTRSYSLISIVMVCALLSVMLAGAAPARPAWTRVIVEGTSLENAAAAVRANGGRVVDEISIIRAVVADVPQARLALLAQTPGVVRVTANRSVESAGGYADVEFAKPVGAKKVWEAGYLGAGVTVAVLDSGIDPTFLTLHLQPVGKGRGKDNRYLAYYDAIGGKLYDVPLKSPGDPNGHGTHVSGIIGDSFYEPQDKEYRGLAPAANLVAVRVLDKTGVGKYSDVLKGLEWVVKNKDKYKIRVLNISMYAVPVAPYWADPYNLAVMAAWKAGIVVVASAGNGGPAPMSIGVPGNTPYIITVGAFTDNYTPENFGDDYLPPFSATGPTLDAFVKPDLIAPGAHMVSLMDDKSYLGQQYPENRVNDRHFRMSGTSMSAAVVSGISALMLSKNPALTPDEVKYRLAVTARPQFSEKSGQAAYTIWEQGAGRVWAADAVLGDYPGQANEGMDLAADLAGTAHYEGWTVYDPATNQFTIRDDGYKSWAGGYDTWAGGYKSWAGGYKSWAGGSTNWDGSFSSWADGYKSWAGGSNAWAGGYKSWAGGYNSWASGYKSWAGGYKSWAGGYKSWAGGYTSWAGGYKSWAGGYKSWAGSVGDPAWAGNFAELKNKPASTAAVGINVLATEP